MPRPQAVAFDIIGTVFSLEPVRRRLEDLGLTALALEYLYVSTLRDSFALACGNGYAPFKTVLEGTLDELLAIEGKSATADGRRAVTDALAELTPYPDAKEAFTTLRHAGLRVVALSNGAASSTKALLERAGLQALVDDVLSVEAVKLSKPRPEVYLYAARSAGLEPGAVALVAAHAWDVGGALIADLQAGYVARGRPYPSVFKTPTVVGDSLAEVAARFAGI